MINTEESTLNNSAKLNKWGILSFFQHIYWAFHVTSTDNKRERNTECGHFRKCFFSEIQHPHLKYLGITISQTLMATNSPLFSMMLTVTWNDAYFKIVIVRNCRCFYLPSWCGSVTNTGWVFQPLVHHCLSLFSIFLKPVVVPVLLTWRPLTYGGFMKYRFLLDLLHSNLLTVLCFFASVLCFFWLRSLLLLMLVSVSAW